MTTNDSQLLPIPTVGLGTWKIPLDQTADVVYRAIEMGYRHLDCACDYGNEAEVGKGIAKAISDGICTRDQLWVTSKLWNTYHAKQHVAMACQRSLADLGLEYLDLYLIHFPIAQAFVPFEDRYPPEWFFDPDADQPQMKLARVPISETWQAMEDLQQQKKASHIGVCNFGTALLNDLLSYAKIRPSLLQIELHPLLTQEKLVRFARENDVAVTAFSPLGAESYFSIGMAQRNQSLLNHETIIEIAQACDRTPAQVLLRWGSQRGTSVVVKSSDPVRLKENLQSTDFDLTSQQKDAIGGLNEHHRFNDPGDFCQSAFNTFCPIYE